MAVMSNFRKYSVTCRIRQKQWRLSSSPRGASLSSLEADCSDDRSRGFRYIMWWHEFGAYRSVLSHNEGTTATQWLLAWTWSQGNCWIDCKWLRRSQRWADPKAVFLYFQSGCYGNTCERSENPFTATKYDQHKLGGCEDGKRIDYIFYRSLDERWQCDSACVTMTKVPGAELFFSDHDGVEASFTFNKSASVKPGEYSTPKSMLKKFSRKHCCPPPCLL